MLRRPRARESQDLTVSVALSGLPGPSCHRWALHNGREAAGKCLVLQLVFGLGSSAGSQRAGHKIVSAPGGAKTREEGREGDPPALWCCRLHHVAAGCAGCPVGSASPKQTGCSPAASPAPRGQNRLISLTLPNGAGGLCFILGEKNNHPAHRRGSCPALTVLLGVGSRCLPKMLLGKKQGVG